MKISAALSVEHGNKRAVWEIRRHFFLYLKPEPLGPNLTLPAMEAQPFLSSLLAVKHWL